MNRQEFMIFTALSNYLKDLGINLAEFLERDELKKYAEIGEDYLNISNDEFREELKGIIEGMSKQFLK
ncbi:hypothetical protein [Paenibacillus mucilaginosus]|uniref:Uncharacterized protein n=1 Tax=Paenibacillus mucilaginosus (strain KNP414) TaxID=1036673 RepID=F8F677_PAEMK|nr:hypothetical protein [Paenibacillus mucilaginosus]AEI42351.1 hypothetical protein KNP414_03812 [Paenibacillus mucilaginosus KNP414]MCG7214307.1 hypothetical protein [Paenibacillus mucilaginosus]WDM28813.1 hypothetical protein KCX80_06285 [Paenibacillus mucilaginosus]